MARTGGPAGSALAYRLASSRAAPKVLLLEAGGKNDEAAATIIGER
jgi:choline dehydrogenase-like flavoprotein